MAAGGLATNTPIKRLPRTAGEILVILFCSATVGISWNHALLLKAWHGESTAVAAPAAAEATPMPVGLAQAKELFDAGDTLFVDARDRAAFASGHLKGALNLPLGEARQRGPRPLPAKVGAQTVIITYCNGFSCHDSMELGKLLIQAGFKEVYVYEGGFPEWRDAGYPVEKGA